jgi:hypothetical protein
VALLASVGYAAAITDVVEAYPSSLRPEMAALIVAAQSVARSERLRGSAPLLLIVSTASTAN